MEMSKWRRRAAVALVALLTSVAVASPAVADDSGELPSCTGGDNGIGPTYGGGHYTGSGDWYAYSWQFVTLSNSACEDIQITNLYYMTFDMKFRVRFYPSSGGNYANSWKFVNSGCWSCNFVLATNVANGTNFRIEGVREGPPQTVVDENFYLRW